MQVCVLSSATTGNVPYPLSLVNVCQRLSSTFSHFFPLSHMLQSFPLSHRLRISAIISTVNRNQQTEVCQIEFFFIVYVRTLICQLVYSPNNEVYHFLSFYCHSMHNTSYNESVILLSWTWKAINNIFLAILHENQWHLDCFWRPRIT